MGLETATYIDGLVASNPTGSDIASTADDHCRLIKSTVKATFPNVAGAVTPTHTELNYVDGVTSAIQTQLNAKVASSSFPNVSGTVNPTHTELNFVDGVTSAIQTQLDAKLASASYTAADVLTKIKTVDGAGSGLDADTLDGSSSAAFAAASHNHSAAELTSGTVPDARFPATLPAASGVNLTALNATNLASGTVASARVSGSYTGITAIGNSNVNDSAGTAYDIGFRQIPQNSKSAAYTLVAADEGKHIYHPAADTTARIWTIPANASVAYPIGAAITFVNDDGAGAITIAITTDTLVMAPTGDTGSRTLTGPGIATAIKVTSTRWMISGAGLT